MLYLLDNSSLTERFHILRLIKRKNNNAEAVRELVDKVVAKGGIAYAITQMDLFREQAIAGLREFPENDARNALIDLMYYITERQK